MSRVEDIITGARTILNDSDGQRYSDPILLKYLNDGLMDFVTQTKCLKQRLFVEINNTSAIYDLSPYVLKFLRLQYKTRTLRVKTQEELDAIDPDWQLATGEEVQYVTFSDMKQGFFRIYPRMETETTPSIDQNSPYGGLVDVTINDDTYQIPSYSDVDSNINHYLIVYAVTKPKLVTLTTTDSEWELNDEYDVAFENFITYKALRSDTDSGNRTFGSEQYQLYLNSVSEAMLGEATSNEEVSDRYVSYRGVIK